jgi:hypothetical protein
VADTVKLDAKIVREKAVKIVKVVNYNVYTVMDMARSNVVYVMVLDNVQDATDQERYKFLNYKNLMCLESELEIKIQILK